MKLQKLTIAIALCGAFGLGAVPAFAESFDAPNLVTTLNNDGGNHLGDNNGSDGGTARSQVASNPTATTRTTDKCYTAEFAVNGNQIVCGNNGPVIQ